MITLVLCSLLFAAQEDDVALTGTVKGVDGKALDGVKVALAKKKDLSAETKTDGAFVLSSVTNVLLPADLKTNYGFSFRDNAIVFSNLPENVSGRIGLYSINGRLISSVSLLNNHSDQQRLMLPSMGSGSYLLAGNINGKMFTRSLVFTEKNRIRSKATAPSAKTSSRSSALRKSAPVAVVDTLIFSKDGYITQRWPLNNFSKKNIKMVLRATGGKPVVYMTKDLSKAGIVAIYNAIGYDLPGEVMVKIHTGEPGGKYFISSERASSVVNQVNGTIVETPLGFSLSMFGGNIRGRDTPELTLEISKEHGFDTIGQGLDIISTGGEVELPVVGGSQLKGVFPVGKNFKNYQASLVLSHFKGHGILGIGGALKNVAFGFAGNQGKSWLHTSGSSKTKISFGKGQGVQKAMAEACKAVHDALEGNVVYINTLDNLVKECDCDVNFGAGQGSPLMDDIGILGSLDPVALDRACSDLVLAAKGGQVLKDRITGKGNEGDFYAELGMKYAQQIGLGSTEYDLVDIDK